MIAPRFSRQAHQFQHVVHRFFPLRGRDFVARAEEIQVLGHLHVLIDAEKIGHVADDMAHGVGLAHHVVAEDSGGAGGGRQEGGQDAQGGGLARAVGADEAEQIALVDGQVEGIERGDVAKDAGQADGGHGREWGGRPGWNGWTGTKKERWFPLFDRGDQAEKRVAMSSSGCKTIERGGRRIVRVPGQQNGVVRVGKPAEVQRAEDLETALKASLRRVHPAQEGGRHRALR